VGRICQPAEERLDDLLWGMDRYQRGDLPADTGRLEYVRAEAVRIGRDLHHPDRPDVDDLVAARRLRHLPEMLAKAGYPFLRAPGVTSERVLVSVNTDNPITFASSLADEFAHLYFALLGRGVAADDALRWLDRARENGYASRFMLRASTLPEALGEVARERRTAGTARRGMW
jgi:hypothetical protein